MSTNKNAVLRYNILDKCFQNVGRKYFFDDLLKIVNDALIEENPTTSGIQTRQLREDIRFMKSDAGYSAPIEAFREGKKAYYRYSEKSFSINNSPLNSTEAEQLKNAISVLQRFEGSPEFEWVNELAPMINDQFGLKNESKKVMGFDSNIDYTGYEFITPIFNAIVNKEVLEIKYRPFSKNTYSLSFHPYYLKQYNNRWFVLGRNSQINVNHWNLALDRIESLHGISDEYITDETDWEDYFYDIIGVTKPENKEIQEVKLLFSSEQTPYIQTKPLHPSQKALKLETGELQVKLNVILNYELEMKILSYGEKVKVISPKSLVTSISQRIKLASQKY